VDNGKLLGEIVISTCCQSWSVPCWHAWRRRL